MTDYAGNSNKDKEPKKEAKREPLKKVVTGDVAMKEKGIGKKLKGIFFGGDFKQAARFVFSDVIVPSTKEVIFDVFSKGSERIIFGEQRSRRNTPTGGTQVSYHNPMARNFQSAILPHQAPRMPSHAVARRQSNDVLLATREEAYAVLETMVTVCDQYQVVSLADLNELLGLPSAAVDNRWGWTNLNASDIRQTRQGYLLELPPMEEL